MELELDFAWILHMLEIFSVDRETEVEGEVEEVPM